MKEMGSYYEDNIQISNRGCDFWESFSLNHLKSQLLDNNASLSFSFVKKHIHEKEELLRQFVLISRTVFYSTGTEELNPIVTIY